MTADVDVCVIGAGAAGAMAALSASKAAHESGRKGMSVVLLERNQVLGKKLGITGKGRANLTHDSSRNEFVEAFGQDGRFLYPAFSAFSPDDLVGVLQQAGLDVKRERGGRVFPVTDRAADVVQAFGFLLAKAGVRMCYSSRVTGVLPGEDGFQVVVENGDLLRADAVVLATGGKSYPGTGSTGDGYRMLADLGHHISPLLPGLVPLYCDDWWLAGLEGVSLEGVALEARTGGHTIGRVAGEIMITPRGVGGPAALSLSLAVVPLIAQRREVTLALDLRPGRSVEEVGREVAACRTGQGVQRYLDAFLPRRFAGVLLDHWRIDGSSAMPLRAKTLGMAAALVKNTEWTCSGSEPLASAIVTVGGVSLKDIDPRSMQSRIVPGLFVAGEVLDLQARTGGFNLQAAFSTGFLAGKSAGEYVAKWGKRDRL